MEEFIISETSKIFTKGVKRYVEKYKVEDPLDASVLLYIKSKEEVGYQVYVDGQFKEEVTIKDILGVKVIDLKGYSVIAPPYILNFLQDFAKELGTHQIDVTIYLNEDQDDVRLFLSKEGKFVREVFLNELIKSKIAV